MGVRTFDGGAPAAVFSFLDDAVSKRGREHWNWKYRLEADQEPAAFYWQDADGSILGFIGLMRTSLRTRGAEHRGAWFVDWHVRAGEQGVGVGIGLLRKAEAAAGMLLTLQGSADTQKILPRLGWKQSSAPSTWVRPVTPRFLSRWVGQRSGRWLGAAARVLGMAASPYLRCSRPTAPRGCQLVEVERFPADYDQVWEARAARFEPAMVRDSAYMNYLCAGYPDGGYRIQLLSTRGETTGHLICRLDIDRGGLTRGRIIDAVWPEQPHGLAAWLVASACRQLQESGADYVECVASTPELEAALGSSRFCRRAPVPIWYHRLANGVPDPDTWHVTFLDCDRAYR